MEEKELLIIARDLMEGFVSPQALERGLCNLCQAFGAECFCLNILKGNPSEAEMVWSYGCSRESRNLLLELLNELSLGEWEADSLVLNSTDFSYLTNQKEDYRELLSIYEKFWNHNKPGFYLLGIFSLPVGLGISAFHRDIKMKKDFDNLEKLNLRVFDDIFKNLILFRHIFSRWQNQEWFKEKLKKKRLTQREMEIILLMLEGYAPKEISARLSIQLITIRDHIKKIYHKLNVHSQLELLSLFYRLWYQEVESYLGKEL